MHMKEISHGTHKRTIVCKKEGKLERSQTAFFSYLPMFYVPRNILTKNP